MQIPDNITGIWVFFSDMPKCSKLPDVPWYFYPVLIAIAFTIASYVGYKYAESLAHHVHAKSKCGGL